jgi:hypothetical protein
METHPPHPQGTHFKPKTSGMAIASLVCGILGICLALPARRSLLEFLIKEREEVLPGSTWERGCPYLPVPAHW